MAETTSKRYKLKEVCIRLAEGHPLYSDTPLSSPQAAADVMRRELASYDREMICVVNVNTKMKPINFNMVSAGTINASLASMSNILKSAILSNAAAFLLFHNHPSGDVTPSQEDIRLTKKCIEASKLIDIPCMDHIIIGGRNGDSYSFRENNTVDFGTNMDTMTVEQISQIREKSTTYVGEEAGKGAKEMANETKMENVQVPDFVQEAEEMLAKGTEAQKRDEVTIKFGKGLADTFTGRDGKEFMRINIPNQDPSDKSPWASFVLPAKAVHENQYGKGLWAKIPAEGTTVVTKPVLVGQDEAGKNIWESQKTHVPNKELKAIVEAYKTKAPQEKASEPRESAREKLDALVKETAAKLTPEKQTKSKSKSKKGPEL